MGKLGILRVRDGWFYWFTGKTAVTALRVVTAVFLFCFSIVCGGGGIQAVPLPPYLFCVCEGIVYEQFQTKLPHQN